MNISEGPQKLIHVEFDIMHRHCLFKFTVMSTCGVNCLWYVVENQVEVNLIFLGL
jgi:hypothetical protein